MCLVICLMSVFGLWLWSDPTLLVTVVTAMAQSSYVKCVQSPRISERIWNATWRDIQVICNPALKWKMTVTWKIWHFMFYGILAPYCTKTVCFSDTSKRPFIFRWPKNKQPITFSEIIIISISEVARGSLVCVFGTSWWLGCTHDAVQSRVYRADKPQLSQTSRSKGGLWGIDSNCSVELKWATNIQTHLFVLSLSTDARIKNGTKNSIRSKF